MRDTAALSFEEHCPMNRGEPHKLRQFFNGVGVSCWRCHKTWSFKGDALVPTYPSSPA